jgi:hypothetical protein
MIYAAALSFCVDRAVYGRVMSHQQKKPVLEKDQKIAEAVRKYLAGEKLTPTEQRIIAYGYTAATRGQRSLGFREDPSSRQ